MKKCKTCEEIKDASEFNKHPTTSDLLQQSCRKCASALNKKRYIERKDEILKNVAKYREENRDSILDRKRQYYLENTDKCKGKSQEWYKNNRDRAIAMNKMWHEKNKDRAKELNKKWVANNLDKRRLVSALSDSKRRAKIKDGCVSIDIKDTLLNSQNGLCKICGVNLADVKIHIDHIMPLSKGGKHDDANLQLLCSSCNLKKSSKTDYHI